LENVVPWFKISYPGYKISHTQVQNIKPGYKISNLGTKYHTWKQNIKPGYNISYLETKHHAPRYKISNDLDEKHASDADGNNGHPD
jgi:hypothetical protein